MLLLSIKAFVGRGSKGRILCGERLFRGHLSSGNSTLGGFDRNPIRNSLYLFYFIFAISILCVETFWGNCQGKIFRGLDFWEKNFLGKEDFRNDHKYG